MKNERSPTAIVSVAFSSVTFESKQASRSEPATARCDVRDTCVGPKLHLCLKFDEELLLKEPVKRKDVMCWTFERMPQIVINENYGITLYRVISIKSAQ